MNRTSHWTLALAVIVLAGSLGNRAPAAAPEVIPHAQDKPPGPALSPEEAIAKMTVPDGFSVELVAAEPDLVNPVAMTFDERGRVWVTESLEYPRRDAGPGARPRESARRHRRRRTRRQVHRLCRRLEHSLGHRRGLRRRVGGQRPGHPVSPGHRRRRTRRQTRSRRHRLRPRRHARAAQLAHLGPRRLALRPQRRVQCLARRAERQGVRVHLRPVSHSSAHARVPTVRRRHEQSLGRGLGHRRQRVRQRLRDRSLVASGRKRLLHSPGWTLSALHRADATRSSSTSTRRPPTAASTTSTAMPIRREYRERLYMGNIHGNCLNVDVLKRDGSTYFATGGAGLSQRQRRLVHARGAKDRPGRLPVRPRLVRSVSLLSGRQPRSGGHRPAQGAALSHSLSRHAAAPAVRPGRKRPTTNSSRGCTARTSSFATSHSGCSCERNDSAARPKLEAIGPRRATRRAKPACTRCGHWSAPARSRRVPRGAAGARGRHAIAPGACGPPATSVGSTTKLRETIVALAADPARRRAAASGDRRRQAEGRRRDAACCSRCLRASGDDKLLRPHRLAESASAARRRTASVTSNWPRRRRLPRESPPSPRCCRA